MAKLIYNESNINAYIKPNLTRVSNCLRNAIQIASVLSIPQDFKYKTYLKNVDNNLNEDLTSIIKINNILSESSKDFNNICDKINLDTSSIENYSISLRQPIIK